MNGTAITRHKLARAACLSTMLSQLSLGLRLKDLERKEVRPIDQVLEAEADAFLRDPANWRRTLGRACCQRRLDAFMRLQTWVGPWNLST
jgi:hypothetical protein